MVKPLYRPRHQYQWLPLLTLIQIRHKYLRHTPRRHHHCLSKLPHFLSPVLQNYQPQHLTPECATFLHQMIL
nr:MAG TPA: hypothetical protein [Caudoviricetes sp.]